VWSVTCFFKANANITLTFCCDLAVIICHISTVMQTVLIKVVGKPFVSRRLKVFGQIMVALVYFYIVSCSEQSNTTHLHASKLFLAETRNAFCGTWYLPHSHVRERTVPIIIYTFIRHKSRLKKHEREQTDRKN